MPTEKKKDVIAALKLEIKQLRSALKESRAYADKLVDCIPYLPADVENLRMANSYFAAENEKLRKENDEFSALLKSAVKYSKQFTRADEFPGPYRLVNTHLGYKIISDSGEAVVSTIYSDFANCIFSVLNIVDKHAKK